MAALRTNGCLIRPVPRGMGRFLARRRRRTRTCRLGCCGASWAALSRIWSDADMGWRTRAHTLSSMVLVSTIAGRHMRPTQCACRSRMSAVPPASLCVDPVAAVAPPDLFPQEWVVREYLVAGTVVLWAWPETLHGHYGGASCQMPCRSWILRVCSTWQSGCGHVFWSWGFRFLFNGVASR